MPDTITAKQLREERFELAKEIRRMADKVNDEKRDFTAEEKQQWEKVNADYEAYAPRIAVAERAEAVVAEGETRANPVTLPGREDTSKPTNGEGTPQVTEEHRALALQGWMRAACGLDLKKRHTQAIKIVTAAKRQKSGIVYGKRTLDVYLGKNYRSVRTNLAGNLMYAPERRALSIKSVTAGAYTIPQGFVNNLEMALLAYANIRQVADVMRTESGQDLPWPTVNDTTVKGSVITENTTVSPADASFGQVMFHAFKYTSGIVLVPVELLEDSAFDLAEWLGNALGIRIGRIQADHMTFGTGAGQCTGFLTAASSGLTFASATAIAADELYTLKHSVDPAYRPNAIWMMHDQSLLFIKKLKDGFGRYLWQSGLAANAPDTLDGDPIVINQSMPQIATTNKSLAYGDFSKFKIRDVNQVRLRRLVERYADADQEGFVMFTRADSNLLDAGTHPIKYGVHP